MNPNPNDQNETESTVSQETETSLEELEESGLADVVGGYYSDGGDVWSG